VTCADGCRITGIGVQAPASTAAVTGSVTISRLTVDGRPVELGGAGTWRDTAVEDVVVTGTFANGGLTLAPGKVEQILKRTATDTPCPAQEPFVYPFEATAAKRAFDATCEGNAQFNGFYGEGIVNAAAAVGAGSRGRN